MAPRPPTNHRRRRRQRRPSISSSNGSDCSHHSDDEVAGETQSRRRPLTTPRTKRRSSTHLNDLVRRQKEEQQQRQSSVNVPVTPQDIARKMESLLVPSVEADTPRERRLIQVAVRCRPRKSRCVRHRGSDEEDGNDSEHEDDSSDDDGDSDGDSERPPHDSVVVYDIPNGSSGSPSPLPAVSVPSHVLALGGHVPRRRFEFDGVFPPWKQQREVYDAVAYDAIEAVLITAQQRTATETVGGDTDQPPLAATYATVVAYGQTGTGKTYTMGMLQHADPGTNERDHGIIPRAVVHILSRVHAFNNSVSAQQSRTTLVVSMSFLQIYLETIQDLLASPRRASHASHIHGDRRNSVSGQSPSPGGLQVRLDPSTNEFYVAGLGEFPIADIADARELLELAAHNRVLAATARNKTSSRSHTLLTISIKQQRLQQRKADADSDWDSGEKEAEHGDGSAASTISFVDLAGSERVEGALHFLHATRKRQELRIREAKFINRSLSALGSVIAALSAQDDRRGRSFASHARKLPRFGQGGSPRKPTPAPHIRFRDSQLTKLLQSRLMNGHGRLVLIATIDDRPANLTETLSTLKFASQCRRVDLSQTRSSKAEAARKQRDETVLKQVLHEVKTMYEEREATLHRQYEARIAALDERVQSLRHKRDRQAPPAPPCSLAAYIALCSLADITRHQQGRESMEHPSFESFPEESGLVTYVADLYRELKEVLQIDAASIEPRRRSSPGPRRSSHVSSKSSTSPARTTLTEDGTAMPPSEQQPPPFEDVRLASAVAVDDSEFQSLARLLFSSGILQSMVVSSDEDDGPSYSQL